MQHLEEQVASSNRQRFNYRESSRCDIDGHKRKQHARYLLHSYMFRPDTKTVPDTGTPVLSKM